MAQEQAVPSLAVPAAEYPLRKRTSASENILKFIRRKPLGAVGFLLIFILFAMTLGTPKLGFGVPELPHSPLGFELGRPWLSPYDEETNFKNASGRLLTHAEPSAEHWLGTDGSGRDNWARIIWGARRSLFVGIWALALATLVGTAIGVISGYFRGWFDTGIQRFMDALQSFPPLLTLILILTIRPFTTEPSLVVAAFALGFVGIPSVQRIVRGVVLSTREQQYVEAARVIGATDARTMAFYILPNIMASIIVVFSTGLGVVILAEAALAFLVPQAVPPEGASWGLMLDQAENDGLATHPWPGIASAMAIALAVLGFNLAGDALRDVLDPRLRLG
ncbi:MAG TPA: ABC transporter permease [Dehalococcoidia bacterium]|jgi:peptide/nickel transport system permease protein|nr:ABC transporter permease [Dehalococcoidia bacterium]